MDSREWRLGREIRGARSGKHIGDHLAVPASGAEVEVEGVDIHRIEDGKIVEHWALVDMATSLQQVGALPATPGSRRVVLAIRETDGFQSLGPITVILEPSRLSPTNRPYLSDVRINRRTAAPAATVDPRKGHDLVARLDEPFGLHYGCLFPGVEQLLEELLDPLVAPVDLGIDERWERSHSISGSHIEKSLLACPLG